MTVERMAQLLAGRMAPATDEDVGLLALVALNMASLRLHEDQIWQERVERVTEELKESRRFYAKAA